ncbi:hypothetical protein [Nocardia blacklockiae]|uniref:hypothetical protein n=1 Tax=Nocardia blacklockiae TaxID=480036 RepID=UPI001895637B|nr:hypothetical protein [Nocardia blacklockiae]MBF6176626.1 hypothetical protein [Nocardia blacklockiae]
MPFRLSPDLDDCDDAGWVIFDFNVGVVRWSWHRVLAYAALMRDGYPPFRLDQGPREPAEAAVS